MSIGDHLSYGVASNVHVPNVLYAVWTVLADFLSVVTVPVLFLWWGLRDRTPRLQPGSQPVLRGSLHTALYGQLKYPGIAPQILNDPELMREYGRLRKASSMDTTADAGLAEGGENAEPSRRLDTNSTSAYDEVPRGDGD